MPNLNKYSQGYTWPSEINPQWEETANSKCTYTGAELWAGLDGPGPAHIDSWPTQSEKKKKKKKYYSVLLNMDTTLCGVFHL